MARNTTRARIFKLIERVEAQHGITLSYDDMTTLRRASMQLSRWCELQCGTMEGSIREVAPGKYRRYTYGGHDIGRAKDMETPALKRIAAICNATGLDWYYQTDCRGTALYVGVNVTNRDYPTTGTAIGK